MKDSREMKLTQLESAPPTTDSNVSVKILPGKLTPVSTPRTALAWPCVDSPRSPTVEYDSVNRMKDSREIGMTRLENAPPMIDPIVIQKNMPESLTPLSTPMTALTWPCVDSPRLPMVKQEIAIRMKDSREIKLTQPESAPPTTDSNVSMKILPGKLTPVSTPRTALARPCVGSPLLPTEKPDVVHRKKDYQYEHYVEDTQFSYDTKLSNQELEDAMQLEILRNRLGRPVNATDADISLDKLRSEGWRRWNTDMDIEYQYETFNGLPVYYGGDKYDSDDSEEFYLDTPENMNDGMRNQRRPSGGDNNSMIMVDGTARCNTAPERLESVVVNHTAEEDSDTSRTMTSYVNDTDGRTATHLWDDTYSPVWIPKPSNSADKTEELRLNRGDVACMSDFDYEDFTDPDVASDTGSVMKVDCNTRKSEKPQSYPDTDMCTHAGKKVIDNHAGDENNPDEDLCCANSPAMHWASGYMDCASYVVPQCLLEWPYKRDRDARVTNNVNDGKLEHSITASWCVNTEDLSYITVCCDCLWWIDSVRNVTFLLEYANSYETGGTA